LSGAAEQPTFGLDTVLAALSNDLLQAQAAAEDKQVGLKIKETEVELSFTVEAKTGVEGGINLRVFGVGLGGGASRDRTDSSVHRVKLTLIPLAGTDRAVAGGPPRQSGRPKEGD
jgi:hypothetical protein